MRGEERKPASHRVLLMTRSIPKHTLTFADHGTLSAGDSIDVYDKNGIKTSPIFKATDIEMEIVSEFVYCNECRTLVGENTCPHGKHHQITYRAESILELIKEGLLPPAVLVRKEISAILLSELFPNRFENLSRIYDDLIPCSGLLETHNTKDFYLELIKMHQTASLT